MYIHHIDRNIQFRDKISYGPRVSIIPRTYLLSSE